MPSDEASTDLNPSHLEIAVICAEVRPNTSKRSELDHSITVQMKHTIAWTFVYHMYVHCVCNREELVPGNILFIVGWHCVLLTVLIIRSGIQAGRVLPSTELKERKNR